MYCGNCGTNNPDTATSCVKCGASLTGSGPGASSASGSRGTVAGINPSGPAVYAGFWRRVGAYLIDYLVLLAAFVAVALVWTTNDASDDPRLGLVLLLTWLAYKVLMESSPYQATLGKLAIGIKVTDSLGNRISIARAVGRSFASFLSGLIVYIGFMMAGFTRRRQALHDMIAGTLVVKKELTPSAVANAGDAAPVSGWLIAALLLLGAVPMIGILAAIAIPAYQDYTIRSQVSEGLNLASAHKAAVAETWDAGQLGFPDIDSSAAGSEALARSGKYVESIEITSGVVTITYGFAAAEPLNGRTLALVPALDENQEIARVCGYGGIPAGYEVIFEDHLRFTDVPEKYLPGTCRGS